MRRIKRRQGLTWRLSGWGGCLGRLLVVWTMGFGSIATAGDWPQFLGPNRDGRSEEGVRSEWTAEGPKVAWRREVGAGFAGPAVAGNRLILHHRRGDEDVVECLDVVGGGATLWRSARPARYRDDFGFDEGPRAVPTMAGDRVFTFGAEGDLTCLELTTGKVSWRVATAQAFGAEKGFFGFACSPLVLGDRVIVVVGGKPGAGIVAFDAVSGTTRWKATDHEAGYASPIEFRPGEERRVAAFTREGLVVLDPKTGKVTTDFPWRSRQHASVNAAAPLAVGNQLFLTASYGTGAVLLELESEKGAAKKLWSGDDRLSSHYASVVHRDGFLFGFHGRQETGPSLRCVERVTGAVRWSVEGLGAGTVLLAGGDLLVLTERGELLVATAAPDGFRPRPRVQVLGKGTRAYPALAGGRLFARDPRQLVAWEVGVVGR